MSTRVVVVFLLLLLAGSAAFFLLRDDSDPRKGTDPVSVNPTGTEESTLKHSFPNAPLVARCPVARPTETIDPLKDVIANGPESLLQQFKELERLQAKPFDTAAADWLRWMIHQDERHETLRNEAGKVLLNWDPEWLVGDLAGMMEDPAQSETWRNYCVQHLWAHRSKYKDEASLKAIELAANSGSAANSPAPEGKSGVEPPHSKAGRMPAVLGAGRMPAVQGDWVIRSQAVFSLANIANEEKWKETQPQRIADLSAKLKAVIRTAAFQAAPRSPDAESATSASAQGAGRMPALQKGYSHGPSAQIKYDTAEQKAKATERIQKFQTTSEDLESAFVSVQMLELKDLAPEAEAFAGDESNDLAVRTAAIRALITIGRPESIPVLEKCAASNHRVLAKEHLGTVIKPTAPGALVRTALCLPGPFNSRKTA